MSWPNRQNQYNGGQICSFPNQKLCLLMEDIYDTALDDSNSSAYGRPAFCSLRSLDQG
jgi:hypothetical protein